MKKHLVGIVLTLALILGLASLGLASMVWKTNAIPTIKVSLSYVDPPSGTTVLRNFSGVGLNYLEINRDMNNNNHYVLLHTENYSNMQVELSTVGGGLSTSKGTEINGTWRTGLTDNVINFGVIPADMAVSDIHAVSMTGTYTVNNLNASSPTITMTAAGLLNLSGKRIPAKVTVTASAKGIPSALGNYTSIGSDFIAHPPSVSGAPIASSFSQSFAFGAIVPPIDVIANSPNYGDPLTVDIPSGGGALNGTAVLGTGVNLNKIVYTPNEGFSGKDTFSYKFISGLFQSNIATVTVNIGPARPKPYAALQDFNSIPKDSNAADHSPVADWDPAIFTLSVPTKSDMGGALSMDVDKINYKPVAGFDGTDTAKYTLTDKLGRTITGTALFEVTPHAVGDYIESAGGVSKTVTSDSLLSNDSAGAVFDNAYSIPGYGTVNVSGGNITYYPTTSSPSTEYFAYTIKDSTTGKKSIALVTVKIK